MDVFAAFRRAAVACASLVVLAAAGQARADNSSDLLPTPTRVPTSHATSSNAPSAPTNVAMNLANAGTWLIGQRYTSGNTGAFPWTPGDAQPAPRNTQGATAEGLLRLYKLTGSAAALNAAVANGQCQINNCIPNWTYSDGSHSFATHDPLFLVELSQFSGDPQYANFVDTNFWQRLTAGTYGGPTNNYTAAGWANHVLTGRTAQGYPELVAWDLSKAAVAAQEAGQTATAQAFMTVIQASINAADATHNTFDVVGLAGGIWASNVTGIALNATSGTWNGANNTADLAARLATFQAPGGGFVGSTSLALSDANADVQTTGYVMLALASTNRALYANALLNAGNYAASLQLGSGEILSYQGAAANYTGSVESHGEALEAYVDTIAGVDRWVAPTGADSGDCSIQASPCQTIAYAISQAGPGNTIHVASGTYDLGSNPALSITKDELILQGEGATQPQIKRTAGGANQALLVINGAKNVQVQNLEFDMDQTFVAEGIIANGFVDGLSVDGNKFVGSQSLSSTPSDWHKRNAISINDDNGNSQNIGIATGSNVSITNNTIQGPVTPQIFMRMGVDMDNGVGTISGNTITTGVHDIRVRFSTVTGSSSGTTTTIDGNTLNGRGLEFDMPNGGIGSFTISNNQINALAGIDGMANNYPADFSIMRLNGNPQNLPVTVSGNTFAGYQGSYRGVLVDNFPNTTFTGNTFTPANGVSDFVSLVVSNKALNTDNPPDAPLQMSITANGNTFNGSGVSGAGRAVEFLNDNANVAGPAATFGSLTFGTTASHNSFDGNLRWYFHLDDYNCETATASGSIPVCNTPPLPNYADDIGAGAHNTDVRPFTGNVSAANNTFAGAAPSASNANAILARTYDNSANPVLGDVDYGLTETQSVVYVDTIYSGSTYGQSLAFPFSNPNGACGVTTAYFGVNAFATIPDGLTHVQSGGTVCVAKGTYPASVSIATNPVQIIGDGNTASDTVISGGVTLSVSGASSAAPLLLQNLRVSNAAGKGVNVGTASHLAFDQVAFAFAGNGQAGLDFGGVSDDVVITGSLFDSNGGAGLRTASTAQVSNVNITGTTFSNNAAGIILFGASGSGNGQITNWTIDTSQFLSNDNANTNGFGGGIWIKTGGAGSAINGFTVTGSTFADNGSSSTLNQVGITVRARAGTTLQNVSICNNTFGETVAPGTQLTGINVVDLTGNTGYRPITVCSSNTFTGLGHSISGLEQHNSNGTQPVVYVTGGSIANTEYINGPVTRVRDSALFPTITLAMNDAGTTTGDTILVGTGLYSETVTVTHDSMTLTGGGTTASVVDGGNAATPGITLPNGRLGTTISNLAVQNVHQSCIYGALGNNNTTVTGTLLDNCRADLGSANGGGLYMNGPVDSVAISGNEVTASAARGIVIWNGFKTHITITNNNVHDLVGACCNGIDLQDGTASGVTVTGNTVTNTQDSGMGFMQLTSGAGPNLIANNTLNNTGRFGIEIKNPNGTGLATGDGSIVVSGNTVIRPATPTSTDQRDVGGIVVIRRGYCSTCGETDITTGAIVTGNTVSGWTPSTGSPNQGFGIVAEGTNSQVSGNTLNNNQIGVQFQAGNDGYPGDSNQNATNAFFSRGNAPNTCVLLGSNTNAGNGTDFLSVTNPAGGTVAADVHDINNGTFFCSIQSAIDAATTSAGDTLVADPDTYAENVTVNKSLTLQGPFSGTAGTDGSRGTNEAIISPATGIALKVNANNVTFDGFTIQNVADTAIASGGNYGGISDTVSIINNRVLHVSSGSGLYTNGPRTTPVTNWTVSNNLFDDIQSTVGSGINLWAVTGGTIAGNTVTNSAFGGIQVNGGNTVTISGNTITGTAHNGINIAQSTGVTVTGNTVTDANTSATSDEAGMTLYGGTTNVTFACNSVAGSGTNGFSTAAAITDPFSGIKVFDNAITVSGDVSHNLAQSIAIGSNWYGGGNATVGGSNAAGAYVADPLPANPIGNAACGDNTPTQIVLRSGSNQFALITNSFASPLVGRIQDVLGGAVMGESMQFTPPASGASANLGTPSGMSDFNGIFSTTAIANSVAGPYAVSLADAGQPLIAPISFMLTNQSATASIVLDAATLNATYDGNPHAVTATTTPAGKSYTVTYNGSATAPTNAGTYNVVATINDPSYSGSTSGTLTIAQKPETLTLTNLSQVYDGSPKSVTVTVSPDASVAYSVTYNGSSTAPSAVGTYSVVATVIDPNYTGSSTATLTITQASAPDVKVSINDSRSYVQYGKQIVYTILVQNIGSADASGVTVAAPLPLTQTLTSATWTCAGYGATCGAASGSGDLSDTAVIPQNGVLVYTLTATANDDPSLTTDQITMTATATVNGTPADSNPANNTATTPVTQIVIFRDGFETGGDGAQNAAATTPVSSMDANATLSLDPANAPQGQFVPQAWLRGVDANGRTVFSIDVLRIRDLVLMRLSVSDANGNLVLGAWEQAEQFAFGFTGSGGKYQAMFAAGKSNVQAPLPAWVALPVQVYTAK